MFADSLPEATLLESPLFEATLFEATRADHGHRGWTALISFSLQALAVGALLAIPLLYDHALPQIRLTGASLIAPGAPPPLSMHGQTGTSASHAVPAQESHSMPLSVPQQINQVVDPGPIAQADASVLGVRGGVGDSRSRGSVFDSAGLGLNMVLSPPAPVVHQRPASHMMEGNLVTRVQPVYPPVARQARIQGPVVLQAVISREGTIENVQVVSGHPMLVQAALDAVRRWKYRPYMLNGEPIEVETQVTVNFVLGG